MPYSQEEIQDAHASKRVDLSKACDGVWLVKVPKYLAQLWEQEATGDCKIGKLVIKQSSSNNPNQKNPVTLITSDELMEKGVRDESGEMKVPKEHNFILGPTQELSILREEETVNPTTGRKKTELSIFGHVKKRAECRPSADVNYMNLKRHQLEKHNKPTRTVKRLQKHHQAYKPVADHKHNIEYEQRKQAEGKKSKREKEDVRQMLYSAFENHQYYNIRDLVALTQQPLPWLKDILREIAIQCQKPPHKGLWELKEEFRHYEPQEDDEAGGGDSAP